MTPLSTEDRARLDGHVVVASVSGGKDSAAMSLWLTENGIEHRRVFADTGWEHPATYEYLRGPLTAKLGPIDEVRGDLLMANLIRKKGMFPGRKVRFCTEELKVKPIVSYVRAIEDDCLNAVGIRASESLARSKLLEWEYSDAFDCDVWRPLIRWSEQDVIDMHQRHDLAPNPLYLRGAERVGCFPCIFARKRDIKLVADSWPERIDEIRSLEEDVQVAARKRYAERGETRESLGYLPPTFFAKSHRPKPKEDADELAKWIAEGGNMLPIDEAVAWSRTAYGGKQLLLLDTEPAGCVRWGLCESVPPEREDAAE